MGKTKTDLFSPFHNQLALMAKAIAHPARIAILEHLINKGTCVCGDIVEELPLSQSTVSQHLKSMKEAGIIKGDIEGPFTCYCIDNETCMKLFQHIKQMFSKVGNCC